MRHHKAAQRGENGPWHYVSLGRDGGYPIGYCTDACTHETADEATEHYRQWMLDNFRFDGRSGDDTQYRCEIPIGEFETYAKAEKCGRWTQRLALGPDGWATHHVCDDHADRESVELLYPVGSIGESWES